MNQTSIFDMLYPKYKIAKPIRLIEFFAGYGSQALALKYLGVPFEHWKICEWAIKSIQAYKDIHFPNVNDDWNKNFKVEDIKEHLYNLGISSNYNEPMTKEQINRLSETQTRQIHSNICNTNNLVNIQQVKGKDLEIENTDEYNYILTYSFPCQDLSLAGKGKGMSDTSTRSGLLWEVERILTECYELGNLPQVLLMENVPQVHSQDNVKDFYKWQVRLEELGYKNYMQDLIATDYGIPQTRNRCFMVSILGDYSYTFPQPIPLKLKLKDMLEENVNEKYYLSDKMINFFYQNEQKQQEKGNGFKFGVSDGNVIAKTITTRAGSRMDDNFVYNKALKETLQNNEIGSNKIQYIDSYNKKIRKDDLANTITTRVSASNNDYLLIKNATKQGYSEATDGDGVDLSMPNSETRRGRVQKEAIQTITTQNNLGVVTKSNIKNINNESETFSTLGTNCGSSTSAGGGVILKKDLRIRKLTPKECFRLMGVKDEDFEKCAKNQSNSSLYHLAGDSLVTLVFCAIMSTMIDDCKSFEQVLEEFYLQIPN